MYQYKGEDKPSAVERAMEQIIRYLMEEGLGDGERLPNERELAERLGVGRSTLREALQRLTTRNVLEVRRGVGTFVSYKHGVADDPLGFTLIRDKERLARDLLEFRILIEPRAAALAALHATDADIAELDFLCSSVDDLIRSGEPHLERDQEFHTCIARCGGNIIMPKLLPIIHGAIGLFIAETGGQLRDETIRTHRAIFNAIRAHDPVAANDAMYLHLIYNRDRLQADPISRGGRYAPK
ncbi:hypothetical protein B5F17_11585 [Butyricicoccus pullicaecorum]|uniref:HTH gntR-type domain-containing protein n=1 Tax=Butyricicoccus pullicaecorum TaxID=501571 RepID=A0A1Y4L536_9FIRM|nr:FadR/GntR family transcriptional regulator [Butyricicoccus pullicaecorum]OUP51766.1 hypothetical protein B5F17_11585 [Butyricicoccus pullicaecorum]